MIQLVAYFRNYEISILPGACRTQGGGNGL